MRRLHPDRIWRGGVIRAMAGERQPASALASLGGRILAVGEDDSVCDLAGPGTEVIDLHGATVLPGFFDTHTHLVKGAKSYAYEHDLGNPACSSVTQLQARLREWAQAADPGAWIVAGGLRTEKLAERRYPTREDIDAAVPDRPVLLLTPGSHVAVANTPALRAAGISAATPDPDGGVLDRLANGEPTGVLRERGKLRLSERHPESVYPRYPGEQAVAAVETAARDLLAPAGITSVGAIIVGGEELRACAQAVLSGRMPVRVSAYLRIAEGPLNLDDLEQVGLVQGFGGSRMRFGGVKISIDGGTLQRQAAVYDAYPDDPGNRGILRVDPGELDDLVLRSHARGYRVLVHAIGDRAADMALTAFERALTRHPATDHRHRIEHFGNLGVSDDQIARARAANLIASPQPAFMWEYGDEWLDIYGRERLERVGSFRSLQQAGVPVIGSSDYAMTVPSPLQGVQFAVTRRTKGGQVLAPEQAIGVADAFRLYTTDAAYADFAEDRRGALEPGKAADLAVLAEDPFRVSPERIGTIPVVSTAVAGEVIHRLD